MLAIGWCGVVIFRVNLPAPASRNQTPLLGKVSLKFGDGHCVIEVKHPINLRCQKAVLPTSDTELVNWVLGVAS